MYNKDNYLRLITVLSVITFLISFFIIGDSKFSISQVSLPVTVVVIFHFAFVNWLWKLPIFKKWLVKAPNLHGTWEGETVSNWINPETGQKVNPIPTTIFIRQKFDSINVEMRTGQSESESCVAEISIDEKNENCSLWYSYRNEAKKENRDGNPIHFGTTRFSIYSHPELELEGEYWTSRETTGTIKIKRTSKDIVR